MHRRQTTLVILALLLLMTDSTTLLAPHRLPLPLHHQLALRLLRWACIPQRLMSMEASPERRLHLCRHLVRVLSSLKLHQRMYHQVRVVASSELLVHLCPHMVRMVASPLDPMVWELVEYGSLLHQMILGTSLLLPRDKESPLMRLVAFLLHPQYRRQNNLDCRLPKVVVLMNLGALLRGKAMIPCRRIRRAEQQLYRQMTLQV